MANVGYIRVSTADQNPMRQLENVKLDKVFSDKVSGVEKRKGLTACLQYLREGDMLHVHSIDRLARSFIELNNIVNELTERGIVIRFHTEGIIFDSNSNAPIQMLLFQVLGAFSQFERACIRERQREGIALAKAKGKQLGRPKIIDKDKILERLKKGDCPSDIAQDFKISTSSIYKLRKRFENEQSQ